MCENLDFEIFRLMIFGTLLNYWYLDHWFSDYWVSTIEDVQGKISDIPSFKRWLFLKFSNVEYSSWYDVIFARFLNLQHRLGLVKNTEF